MKIDALPAPALAKLNELRGAAVDAGDAARAATERINQLQEALGYGREKPSAAQALELERLQAQRSRQTQRQQDFGMIANHIQQWTSRLPNGTVLVGIAAPPSYALRDGETPADAIGRLHSEIAAVSNHLDVVKSAPLPKADAKALVRPYVEQLRERGRPKVTVHNRGTLNVAWVDPQKQDFFTHVDAAALLAWCDPTAMIKALEREIDAMPDERRDAMLAAERERRVAELSANLELLERQEEVLIERAAEQGQEIARREDASPSAILSVVVQAKAAQAAA
jgi:hypothetical protein